MFRLHKDRVYYVSEKIMKLAANVSRDNLVSLGKTPPCFYQERPVLIKSQLG